MAGCIEDLFTQFLWDFDRLKGLNCSPMEERFQDFVHGYPLCCYYNIDVLQMQHINAVSALDWVHSAVRRRRFGAQALTRPYSEKSSTCITRNSETMAWRAIRKANHAFLLVRGRRSVTQFSRSIPRDYRKRDCQIAVQQWQHRDSGCISQGNSDT
jgi:hypothetical protein